MKKMISLAILLLLHVIGVDGQSIQEKNDPVPKIKAFSLSAGGIYYNFRDEITSDLLYRGLGGGHFGLRYHINKGDEVLQGVRLSVSYGEAKAPLNSQDDYATIYGVSAGYSHLRKITRKSASRLTGYLGASAFFDGINIVYPLVFGNNDNAYSIDILSLEPSGGIRYRLGNDPTNFPQFEVSFWMQFSLFAVNLRPQSYSGVARERIREEYKLTSLHNNLKLKNRIEYALTNKKRQQLKFSYSWNFQQNTSTLNPLSYAQHNLTFTYQFHLKNKKK